MLVSAVLLLGLLTGGCAAPTPRPRIEVISSSREAVESQVISYFVGRGYRVNNADRLNLRFDKEGDALTNFFFGSTWNPTTHFRIYITVFNETPGAVHIVGNAAVVTNPGSGYEHERNLTDTKEFNAVMEQLREKVGGTAIAPAPPPPPPQKT